MTAAPRLTLNVPPLRLKMPLPVVWLPTSKPNAVTLPPPWMNVPEPASPTVRKLFEPRMNLAEAFCSS